MSHVPILSTTLLPSLVTCIYVTCSYSNTLLPFSVHLKDVVNVSLLTSISVHIFEYTQETGPMSVLSMAATNDLLSLLTSNHTCSHMPSKLETRYGNLSIYIIMYVLCICVYTVHVHKL